MRWVLSVLLLLLLRAAALADPPPDPKLIEPPEQHVPIEVYYNREFFNEPWRRPDYWKVVARNAAGVAVVAAGFYFVFPLAQAFGMNRWGVAVLFLALVAVNYPMEKWYQASFPVESQNLNRTQALLSVLGGMRAFIAQMLWFKSDVYHHEIEQETGAPSEMDPNVVDMTRFITVLDPHFVPAYDVGSFDLYLSHQLNDALAFDEEGIRNNPGVEILWFNDSFYLFKLKRFAAGEQASLTALSLTHDPFEQINCLRMVAVNSEGNHDREQEINAFKLWLLLRPGDSIPQARLDAVLKEKTP